MALEHVSKLRCVTLVDNYAFFIRPLKRLCLLEAAVLRDFLFQGTVYIFC